MKKINFKQNSLLAIFSVLLLILSPLSIPQVFASEILSICNNKIDVACSGLTKKVNTMGRVEQILCDGKLMNIDCDEEIDIINETTENIIIEDPEPACQARIQNASTHGEKFEIELGLIEEVGGVLFLLGTSVQLADNIIDLIGALPIIGGAPMCSLPSYGGSVQSTWHNGIYSYVEPIICKMNNGWCSGDISCGHTSGGVFSSDSDIFKGESFESQQSMIDYLNPKDNIYTAYMCGSLFGIISNLRKMKQVSKNYECCMEMACELGIDQYQCDQSYKKESCMFYVGSIPAATINMLSRYASKALSDKLAQNLIKNQVSFPSSPCVSQLWDLSETVNKVTQLDDQFNFMISSTSVDVDCDQIKENYVEEFNPNHYGHELHNIAKAYKFEKYSTYKEFRDVNFFENTNSLENSEDGIFMSQEEFIPNSPSQVYLSNSRTLALSNKISGFLNRYISDLLVPVVEDTLCGEDGYYDNGGNEIS